MCSARTLKQSMHTVQSNPIINAIINAIINPMQSSIQSSIQPSIQSSIQSNAIINPIQSNQAKPLSWFPPKCLNGLARMPLLLLGRSLGLSYATPPSRCHTPTMSTPPPSTCETDEYGFVVGQRSPSRDERTLFPFSFETTQHREAWDAALAAWDGNWAEAPVAEVCIDRCNERGARTDGRLLTLVCARSCANW